MLERLACDWPSEVTTDRGLDERGRLIGQERVNAGLDVGARFSGCCERADGVAVPGDEVLSAGPCSGAAFGSARLDRVRGGDLSGLLHDLSDSFVGDPQLVGDLPD